MLRGGQLFIKTHDISRSVANLGVKLRDVESGVADFAMVFALYHSLSSLRAY
jgi:hypothetical protein